MATKLYPEQLDAIKKMKNGCILAGDTGTGKSRTSLAYYYIYVCNGGMRINGEGSFHFMKNPRDLYIITTAKKRDSFEWEVELSEFLLLRGENKEQGASVYIDSWNNIGKYRKVVGAFFIFDEQRLVGSGAWVKAFLDIARKNQWVLLSATPGDKWIDYIPVFVANGFYKNRTEFNRMHVKIEYMGAGYRRYPKITGYFNEGLLVRHRRDILVNIELKKKTVPHYVDIRVDYDKDLYRTVWRDRWDPFDDEPIEETGKLMYLLRKVVNDDDSRYKAVQQIFETRRRLVIFYNYSYELHGLRSLFESLGAQIGEWNGELHTSVPRGGDWVYLVQYSAGCEGWNCITTDTIVFFSQSYSYRMTHQAEGRIDRANTPYTDLYYYRIKSTAPIDLAIARALSKKKDFNERSFRG